MKVEERKKPVRIADNVPESNFTTKKRTTSNR